MGLTARFSRFFILFGDVWTLLAEKQPENRVSNKGLQLYDPQLVGYAQALARYTPFWYCRGSRLNPDVGPKSE